MQISKYKSPKLQIVGANLQLIHGGTGPSKYAASRPTGHYLLGWSSLWHSLNKHVGPEDEFRIGHRLDSIAVFLE